MNNKKLAMIVTMLLFHTNIFTQESNPEKSVVTKTLGITMEGGSGNLNPGAGTILDAEGEFGCKYMQNFANAQWLTVSAQMNILGFSKGIEGLKDEFLGNNKANNMAIKGYAKLILGLTRYFSVGVNTFGRIDTAVGTTFSIPANQSIKVISELNIFPAGNSLYSVQSNFLGQKSQCIVDYWGIHLGYGIKFAKNWGFNTIIRFRTSGISRIPNIASDTGQAILNNFNIRWSNNFSYQDPNGVGVWVELRYNPMNITLKNVDTVHLITIHGGVSFSYDLSKT